MSAKLIVWICVFLFSIIGGYIPVLFGSSFLSYSSILGNAIGGVLGIWLGIKISGGLNK